jgi:uncharacterized protein (DUF1778 family)
MDSMGERQRRSRISIRVSVEERSALQQGASRSGLSLSGYVRCVLLGAKPLRAARRPRVETALLVQILDRLGVVASNLLQITAAISTGAYSLMPSCERDLSRCLLELRSLRPALLGALGKRPGGP